MRLTPRRFKKNWEIAARQVEKSLGRSSPAVSAIAAPPKQTGRESGQSLGPHGRARIVQGGTEGGGREGLRCNDRYSWALT